MCFGITHLAARGLDAPGRWEFVTRIADNATRRRYVNTRVGDLFAQSAHNPINYVKIPGRIAY